MGASYNYEFEQASPSINAETLALIQRLYRASDTKGEGAEWADCFTEDAKIWLLGNIASGKKGMSVREAQDYWKGQITYNIRPRVRKQHERDMG